MEGVRQEHLGSAYMEEPRRSNTDTVEEMEVGTPMGISVDLAAGVHGL